MRGTRQLLQTGQLAPDFDLQTLDGTTCRLTDVLTQGPALVAFYKVSCPTCQLTLPFLERINGHGVQVLTVSQNPPKDAREFNRNYGITASTLLDQASHGYPASNDYGISHVPSLFLVGSDGRISWTSVGFSKKDLEDLGRQFGVKMFGPGDRVPDFKGG